MTAPQAGRDGPPEAAFVLLIDFRAAANGPGQVDPAGVDERTLHKLQHGAAGTIASAGPPEGASTGEWRILNFERLLVVDDAAGFAKHGEAYRFVLEAPTSGRMLCVVVGAPAEPPYLDVPKSVDAARVPVLWIGDACGVGWRVGWSTTTRLAFSGADPDGTITVANLIESLTAPETFDQAARAIDGLPERTGAVAVLPWARWPVACEPADEPGDAPDDDQPDAPVAEAAPPDGLVPDALVPDDPGPGGRRTRRWAMSALVGLTCAVVGLTTVLALEVSRLSTGYLAVVGVVGVILLAMLAAASRRAPAPPARPVSGRAISGPQAQPEPPAVAASGSPGPPPSDTLDHARWMMHATAADESFRQLTSPEQLIMLGGELALVRLVRFAPVSARPLLDPFADGEDVAWTTSGNQVGVIRLAPLKSGLVRPRDA